MSRMPTVFVGHGSPMLALDDGATHRFMMGLGATMPKPQAILVVSAHWETASPRVSAVLKPRTIHDFGGFPRALFEMQYPAPGAPDLAARVAQLLPGTMIDEARGLDHGAWVPLKLAYPAADVPATQLSVQTMEGPAHAYAVGQALRPLRDEGVLILGSGSLTHNLHEFRSPVQEQPPKPWVTAFADWVAERIAAHDIDSLLAYREKAPFGPQNHPTEEHLLPLFTVLGALDAGEAAVAWHRAYTYGILAMDAWGSARAA
ncbi:dioxygenase [Zavarzinia aquatilis]|uniref:Dioxygenase n=1 Tax=Zavarzinia aquatilis TaxID=2211142 RepID=A0A317ECP7_9PROT|nr:class III extradiol ring-cleavage dioxygenase [Zavarzinia aquatilis]PWR24807.1 dioxygenase [Zavarzinia aquatilis]